MRPPGLVVLVVALAGCAAVTSATSPPGSRGVTVARERLAEARTALARQGDPAAALARLGAAIDAEPGNVEARALRAQLLQVALDGGAVGAADRGTARRTLMDDLAAVIRAGRDPLEVAIARDGLRRLDRQAVVPPHASSCPEVPRQESRQGYDLVLAGRPGEALEHYRRAVAGCPEDAHAWAFLGSTAAMVGEADEARTALRAALARDAWNRAAHGFLADLELRAGHWQAARESAVLGVLSDPTSEVGWERLRQVTLALGGAWHRVPNERPLVRPGRNGRPAVFWPFRPDDRPPGEVLFWEGLALSEVAEIAGHRRPVPEDGAAGGSPAGAPARAGLLIGSGSALGADERRTRTVLEVCRRVVARDRTRDSEVYRIMERSDEAGFLDEAIFLLLMDRRLVPEYLDYRDRHRPRLVAYVTTFLAPIPGGARP